MLFVGRITAVLPRRDARRVCNGACASRAAVWRGLRLPELLQEVRRVPGARCDTLHYDISDITTCHALIDMTSLYIATLIPLSSKLPETADRDPNLSLSLSIYI